MYPLAQEEEALKAAIISHARVVYGADYPAGSVFYAISTTQSPSRCISHVVVYPKTKPFAAGEVVSGKCTVVASSIETVGVEPGYKFLLERLRFMAYKVLHA